MPSPEQIELQQRSIPNFILIGSQSSGKTSVIESLVGETFLPCGIGIVTRRPLVLQLIYSPLDDKDHRTVEKGTTDLDKWGEFLHTKNKVYVDFDDIRKEIEIETDRKAGPNKGICSEPINLKIYSTRFVNLVLVDLPGLPDNDQAEDIKLQTNQLILKYIKNPNSTILLVNAANNDLATSESLKMAKEVDPDGRRTLIVVTKLDLMDAGADVSDILSGRTVKLRTLGVVNRSQQDIIDKKSIKKQLKDEANYLQRKYPDLAASNGAPALLLLLNGISWGYGIGHALNCPDHRSDRSTVSIQNCCCCLLYQRNTDSLCLGGTVCIFVILVIIVLRYDSLRKYAWYIFGSNILLVLFCLGLRFRKEILSLFQKN